MADEATIKQLDKYKGMVASLTDPRKTTEQQAQQLIKTAKPIYWITSGMHSTENGGPEMLIELPYRLAVEDTPFIQAIRNNVITLITPVIEVDGREKQVDTYYFNKKRRAAGDQQTLPLMYWGKYVAHDNNRDGMGQFLALTRNVTKAFLEWKPTDDARPARAVDVSLRVNRHRSLQRADRSDHHRRVVAAGEDRSDGDDQARRPRRVDLRVLRRLGAELHVLHRARAQLRSAGSTRSWATVPRTAPSRRRATTTSREWFRPNPPLPTIQWGPRNNTNIQQSAILIALNHVAKNKETYLENYWLKNKRAAEKGKTGPVYGWVIPAAQKRKADAAEAVNELRRQGLEFHTATTAFKAGTVDVKPGDYIVRGDQPYRTIADMYFSVQNYAPSNPQPYDDTGWTFQYMRNLVIKPIAEHGRARSADGRGDRRRQGAGRRRRDRAGADRRPHHRQRPRDVPLQAQGRRDGGRGGGVRGGRPRASARARSSSRTPIARRSSRR